MKLINKFIELYYTTFQPRKYGAIISKFDDLKSGYEKELYVFISEHQNYRNIDECVFRHKKYACKYSEVIIEEKRRGEEKEEADRIYLKFNNLRKDYPKGFDKFISESGIKIISDIETKKEIVVNHYATIISLNDEIINSEKGENVTLKEDFFEDKEAENNKIETIDTEYNKDAIFNSGGTTIAANEANYTLVSTDEKEKIILQNNEAIIISNSVNKHSCGSCCDELLYVKYDCNLCECVDKFAILRIPKKNCIIRSHQFGKNGRRGYKEKSFQQSLENYFGSDFEISDNVRFNTGNNTRPYEPDIVMIEKGNNYNIRIDIEIDEPYAAITRQPTHYKGEDFARDIFFIDRGWIVIRFSEYQVHIHELGCLRFVANVIKAINPIYFIHSDLASVCDLKSEDTWDVFQAQKWEKEKYREKYLNYEFKEIKNEEPKSPIGGLTIQEEREEKKVKRSFNEMCEKRNKVGYNNINSRHRDERIVFYPDKHLYCIDNVPAYAASTVVENFFPKFNANEEAKVLKPSHPLYGKPIDEIVELWKQQGVDAANLGTLMHKQVEEFYSGKLPNIESSEFCLFKQFVNENQNVKPYRTEWRIFDEAYNIAGSIDFISKNADGSFDIYDWKRSKKVVNPKGGSIINNAFGKKGVGELDIDDTAYNRYCLQQSLYRYILEEKYELKISKMYLVILHPQYDTYYKVEAPYWRNYVKYILKSL